MSDPAPPQPQAAALPAWRTHLDVESQGEERYPETVNTGLFELIEGSPRRVLELGCGRGAFAAALKARFPEAVVIGIEAGRAPAAIAARRIDRVICARLEDLDLEANGIAQGSIDLVIAADVLEHVVNPWDILVRLKPYLAPGGQIVASIPNVRNALLVAALAVNGRWQYRERGLLDITHLRFFTLEEITRMFDETGYRMERHTANLSPPLADLYNRNHGNPKITLELGRLTLSNLTQQELYEMCAEQFLVRARPV